MMTSSLFRNAAFRQILTKCHRQMCSSQLPRVTDSFFKNPCLDLQEYMEVPLFREDDICFDPSTETVRAAMNLFTFNENNVVRRVGNTIEPKKFPSHDLPEVAFLGRSNAGKTTLLRAIFHTIPDLRIVGSKKPGNTKSLKFYDIGSRLCLVDTPGYGYRAPAWFKDSVIPFLKSRRNLVKTFLLIDVQESFHDWDDASLQMLIDVGVSFAVVLTKIDTVTASVRFKNYFHLRNIIDKHTQHMNTCFPQIFMLSARTFEGLPYFLAFIAYATGNLNPKTSNDVEFKMKIFEESKCV